MNEKQIVARITRGILAKELGEDENLVADFLVKNPDPTDAEFHDWAESQDRDTSALEAAAYVLASKFAAFLKGGFANEKGFTEKDADPKELKMGIEVELEHIPDKEVAKRISLDHLAEAKDYYSRLKKMEKEAES